MENWNFFFWGSVRTLFLVSLKLYKVESLLIKEKFGKNYAWFYNYSLAFQYPS